MAAVEVFGERLLGRLSEDVGLVPEAVGLLELGPGKGLEGLAKRHLERFAHDHLRVGNLVQDLFCFCCNTHISGCQR